MVVTLLYTCTGKEIGTKIGRYRGMEIWREAIHLKCLLSGVDWRVQVGSVRFGWFGWFRLVGSDWLVQVGWFRFLPLHKKIF